MMRVLSLLGTSNDVAPESSYPAPQTMYVIADRDSSRDSGRGRREYRRDR